MQSEDLDLAMSEIKCLEEAKARFDLNSLRKSLKPRTIPIQNIVIRLQRRETFGSNKGIQHHIARKFYQNVFPNFTIVNVEKPPCFLRKFSPDGKYFIAFSSDQTSLEIYKYQGCTAAGDLVQDCIGDHLNAQSAKSELIRNQIFKRFFKLKYVRTVAESIQQLNRECSLFSNCGRYVIIGSASNVAEDRPNFYEIYTNNEAVTPSTRFPLEDYTIYLINLENGDLCDYRDFKVDKIFLSHNQGLYLYKDTLAVLSVQHQTIHIFKIANGKFINVRKIGRNCFEDDDFVLSCGIPMGSGPNVHRPFREATINSLKHRLLVFLYKRAKRISDETRSPYELRKFYQYFDQFLALRMWKMQLLDHDHLLIKYASEDVVTLKATEPTHSQLSFFMIYNMIDAKVLAVYENTSEEFLYIFENFCDYFRNAKLYSESQITCSPSNNTQARILQQRFKQMIISARNGGPTEAVKRLLAQLPISAQSYSSSPYLDLSLFSYDDKWVSVMERPKACGEHPIRFYARDSGLLKFCIYAGLLGKKPPPTARRLVAFTFHPTEPFAISVQRTNAEYVVNFHIRHTTSCEDKKNEKKTVHWAS